MEASINNISSLKQFGRGYAREAYWRIRRAFGLRKIETQTPILIYQMGKVGSSTVVHTLKHLVLPAPILHIHTLSPNHLAHAIRRQRSSAAPFLHEHLIISSLLVKKLRQGMFPCRVITLTREPVARAVSFVFEDIVKQAPEAILPKKQLDVEAIEKALNRLLMGQNGVADPTLWFDSELRDCLGVDVFSQPYDPERGYAILQGGPVSVLVIRMEDLDRKLVPALAAFLEIDPACIAVQKANIGTQKWYADAMAAIKETYQIPPGPACTVFDTKYFKHFYASETSRLVARWR